MAQHKAPTAVTIAPTQEKSGFAEIVERYWKLALGTVVVLTAAILFWENSKRTEEASHDQSWEKLMGAAQEDPRMGLLSGKPEELEAVASQVKGSQAAPWALYIAATAAANDHKYEEARKLLQRLRAEYPTHSLVVDKFPLDETGAKATLVAQLESRLDAQAVWRSANAQLFQNPDPPADAQKVKINTDRGSIVVQLYPALAPKHCENFLRLVREGFYNGIKFHRIVAGSLIQAGDQNTIQGDVATWGSGGAPVRLDLEENNLRHFPGFLSAYKKPGEKQSNGSQFVIAVGDVHYLDSQQVVFAKVIEGMEVAHKIEQGSLASGTTDRPEDPATIQSMEVL
jgi:cyclophilin family peptidyl-prolyl cis-trans isomerase